MEQNSNNYYCYCSITEKFASTILPLSIEVGWLVEGLASHVTHYRSYRSRDVVKTSSGKTKTKIETKITVDKTKTINSNQK